MRICGGWKDGSGAVPEYFILDNVIFSRDELRERGILPVRAISLGDAPTRDSARIVARGSRAWNSEAVIESNVRTAVERKLGLFYGLSHDQIGRLQRGEVLAVDDGLGRLWLAYEPAPQPSEEEFEK